MSTMQTTSRTMTHSLKLEELPEEIKAKWEAHKNRQSKNHPLYQTASSEYGKAPRGVVVELKPPEARKVAAFADTDNAPKGGARSTLDCSIAKHRYMKDLDPL